MVARPSLDQTRNKCVVFLHLFVGFLGSVWPFSLPAPNARSGWLQLDEQHHWGFGKTKGPLPTVLNSGLFTLQRLKETLVTSI